MKPLFDLHTHTTASGHAFGTLKENIEEAAKKGLAAMGTSDHSKNMPGTCDPIYFGNYKVVRDEIFGVRIYTGMEANIIGYDGRIDMSDGMLKKMDYVCLLYTSFTLDFKIGYSVLQTPQFVLLFPETSRIVIK